MAFIALKWFGGMIPRRGRQHLPAPHATEAENCNLMSGELRPLKKPATAHVFCTPVDDCWRAPFPDDPSIDPEPPPEPPQCVPVVITSHPTPTTTPSYIVGEVITIQLTVNADATVPIQIQWYRNGIAIPGATDTLYTFTLGLDDALVSFTALVQNPCGQELSQPWMVPNVVCEVTVDATWTPILTPDRAFEGAANDPYRTVYGNHGVIVSDGSGSLLCYPEGTFNYIGNEAAYYYSTNYGDTWTKYECSQVFLQADAGASAYISSMDYSALTGRFYASLGNQETIFYTTNGSTWSAKQSNDNVYEVFNNAWGLSVGGPTDNHILMSGQSSGNDPACQYVDATQLPTTWDAESCRLGNFQYTFGYQQVYYNGRYFYGQISSLIEPTEFGPPQNVYRAYTNHGAINVTGQWTLAADGVLFVGKWNTDTGANGLGITYQRADLKDASITVTDHNIPVVGGIVNRGSEICYGDGVLVALGLRARISDDNPIYASNELYVFYSTDEGASWSDAYTVTLPTTPAHNLSSKAPIRATYGGNGYFFVSYQESTSTKYVVGRFRILNTCP